MQTTDSFPEACEALFHHLISRLIIPDKDILDIGSGCGESTALLAEMKPRSLRGVTLEKSQYLLSRARFPGVEFINSEAGKFLAGLEPGSVDSIIALDCVYHFPLRLRFLDQAARVLRPGGIGKVALTDLILGDETTFLQRLLLRLICALTASGYGNFKTAEEYLREFKEAGFVDVELQDISEDVFLGLAGFIGRQRSVMKGFGIEGKWGGYLVFKRVLEWWSTGVVRFVVVWAGT